MPGALDTLRETRASTMTQLSTLSQTVRLNAEQQAEWDRLETEIGELDGEIERRQRQAERETRAAAARAAESGGTTTDITDGTRQPSGYTVGREPTVYGRGSNHSYFLDLARDKLGQGDGDGGPEAASERLNRHAVELRVDMAGRAERRAAQAQADFERAMLSGNRAERRAAEQALRNMDRDGVNLFERRATNRTDGTGGYLVPPLWLIDELVDFLRAGRDFADLWRNMPLPGGTDSINIPRLTIGAATGPQVADGGVVPGRDMTDNFVTGKVMTIAGQQDAALQLLEQSPLAYDELIFQDLAADYAMQLSGQCYVGSGVNGQINGVWPAGAINNTNGIYIPNTNNTAGQTWVNGGGAAFSTTNSVFQGGGQMLSVGHRTRLRPYTHHVWHPWVWYYLLTQVDQAGRPLVVPGTPNNIGYNQAALDNGGMVESGPVGFYQGRLVVLDPNMPVTFPAAGGTNPQITTISNGQFAPTPGSGLFTPLLAGAWQDMFLWEGEMRTRALTEVLSGNLQVRFQLYAYVATIPNRFQAYSPVVTGGNTVATTGASVSYATFTQYSGTPANSVLNMTGQGF